jgi:hypothetical protein
VEALEGTFLNTASGVSANRARLAYTSAIGANSRLVRAITYTFIHNMLKREKLVKAKPELLRWFSDTDLNRMSYELIANHPLMMMTPLYYMPIYPARQMLSSLNNSEPNIINRALFI